MIKQYFLYAMAVLVPAGIIGWFAWMLGKALVSMYQDWRLGHELDELKAHASAKRKESAEQPIDGEPDNKDYTSRM